ncbi:hypothetical protein S40293_09241 [Stachybotrys chartarum IBT 40293]|nr:hypothetical protein S40293_09241 [Stachybotrys chartarum IBT 40293]
MEVAGLIIGLSGIIACFEKSFFVWRTIREAENFGDDVADWMCKLEMEFFRFQTWWTALEHIAPMQIPRHSSLNLPSQTSELQIAMGRRLGNPILDAASSVLKLLEEIESILQQNGVLSATNQASKAGTSSRVGESISLKEGATGSRARLKMLSRELMRHTPWQTRVAHTMSPWKEASDKVKLDSSLESIIYWNNALYSILPQNLRGSILELGLAGYALATSNNIRDISRLESHRNTMLSQSARLMELRQRFKNGVPMDSDVEKLMAMMKKEIRQFQNLDSARTSGGNQYSIVGYSSLGGQDYCRVMIEWIPFPTGDYDTHKLARTRMSQISYSLQQIEKSLPLQTLTSLGFIEYTAASLFGLISLLPQDTKPLSTVVTLHELISQRERQTTNSRAAAQRTVN